MKSSTLSDLELEELERKFFDFILLNLKQDIKSLIAGLNSRIKILNDWYDVFLKTARKGYKSSDLDRGAERIFYNFFASILKFPNSSPIGSDLMFEHPDSFIHIEIKTALINNISDYKGKINIGNNQTSYSIPHKFSPNLPTYYTVDKNYQKPCLTYAIQIVHEHAKPNIKALLLICIPNGQLYNHYQDRIFRSGKSGTAKQRDFRFNYWKEPYFKLLSKENKKIFRVELIYLDKTLKPEEITKLKDIPCHKLDI